MGTLRWEKGYVEKVPAAPENKRLVRLFDCVLSILKNNPSEDTADLEDKIDQWVYQSYGLTKQEIATVKRSFR